MVAAVYQDSARYDGTAAENIGLGHVSMMGKPSARRQIEEAAKQLGIYEELLCLPQGLDTRLGRKSANGVELSEGQWQKLILARLFVNPAPVRILDEPASSLDPITESSLYEMLSKIGEDKTVISISHRLGSVSRADRIFVLKEGRLAEEGSHEELLKVRGLYADMYENQRKWYQ